MFWMWVGIVVAVLLIGGLWADHRHKGSVDASATGMRGARNGSETEYRVDSEVIRNGPAGHGFPL